MRRRVSYVQQRFLQSNSLSLVLTHQFYTVSRAVEADSNTDSIRRNPTRPGNFGLNQRQNPEKEKTPTSAVAQAR